MALNIYMSLRGRAAEPPVKSQSYPLTINTNLATSRPDEIWESQPADAPMPSLPDHYQAHYGLYIDGLVQDYRIYATELFV